MNFAPSTESTRRAQPFKMAISGKGVSPQQGFRAHPNSLKLLHETQDEVTFTQHFGNHKDVLGRKAGKK